MGSKSSGVAEKQDDLEFLRPDTSLLEQYFSQTIRQFGSRDREAPAKTLCPVRPEVAARLGLKEPITLFGLKFVIFDGRSK